MDPCMQSISALLINMGTTRSMEVMTESTLHGFNDLGSQAACEGEDTIDATYVTLKLNLTHIPVELISGLCLPRECSQKLQHVSGRVSDKANDILDAIQRKFHILNLDKGYGIVTKESKVLMTLT
mmetsp:Transcript_24992/g.33487  ORF Transcript_24992/g.33487 Transcript_24992/m.33487 type:complete len:125 (+) Transcript_24992:134-508(+)